MHVLVIEDNEDDYLLLKRNVAKMGDVELDWRNTVAAGLTYIKDNPVDMLLLDMNLPDGQGLDLFDQVQSRFPTLPIIILTGNNADEMALEAIGRGAQDYLVKGQFNGESLRKSVRYALERKRSEDRFRALLEAAPDAMVIVNETGKIVVVNAQTEKLFGYTRNELLGQPVEMLLPEPFRTNYMTHREDFTVHPLSSSVRRGLEIYGVRKDGSQFPVEISLNPLETADGHLTSGAIRDITERKEAEDKLRHSEAQYRMLASNLPDTAVLLFDTDMRYTLVEGTVLERIGYNRATLEGKTLREVATDENYAAFAPLYEAALRGEVVTLEQYVEGGVIFDIQIVPIRDGEGKITGGMVVSHNVTERKAADEKLRRSEERFSAIVNSVQEYGMYSLDIEGNIISWNPGAERIKGYKTEEIIGQNYARFFTPEDIASGAPQKHLETAAREGRFTGEGRRVRKDGTQFWAEVSVSAVHDGTGQLIGFSKVTRDLTQRKQAEDALEAERRLLTILMDTIPDIIYFKDTDSRFIRINQAHARIFGLSDPSEAIGKSDTDFQDPELAKAFLAEEALIVSTGEPLVNHEEYNPMPDGTPRWFSSTKMPIKDEHGQIIGIVGVTHNITESKQAADALRESEEKLQTIFKMLPVGASLMDNDRHVTQMNLALEKMLGMTLDDIEQGKHLSSGYVHGDGTPVLPAEFPSARAMTEQRVVSGVEMGFLREDGVTVWASVSAAPLPGNQGVVTVMADITERKQAVEALQESEEKLQTIFTVLPVGTALVSNERQMLQMNPALEKILDMPTDDIIAGKYLARQYLHSDGTPMPVSELPSQRAITEQRPVFDVEVGFVKEDGATVWTSVSAAPLPAGQGIVTVTADITGQKQAKQVLAEERNLLRTLIDNIPDYIFVKDASSRFVIANNAVAAGLGMNESGKLIGKTDADFLPAEIAESYYADDQALMASGHALVNKEEIAVDMQTGEERWLLTTKVPLRDEHGRFASLLGVSRNITESKRLQKQNFDLALDRERFYLLSQFVRDTSHDLRTPLSVINTSTYLLKKLPPEKQLERIELIEEQVGTINKMLETIHYTAQLWSTDHLDLVPTNLDSVIEAVCNHFSDEISAKKQHLKITTAPLTIMAESTYLAQALGELLDNASAFTPENGEIEVCQRTGDNVVIVEFEDNGVGMTREEASKAFDMFWRGDDSRNDSREHHGLGLAIVRRIIELHKGSIQVESQPKVGTTFIISLPMRVA